MHMSKAVIALCVSQGSFILASQCYEGDPQQVTSNDKHHDSDSTGESYRSLLFIYLPYILSLLVAD